LVLRAEIVQLLQPQMRGAQEYVPVFAVGRIEVDQLVERRQCV